MYCTGGVTGVSLHHLSRWAASARSKSSAHHPCVGAVPSTRGAVYAPRAVGVGVVPLAVVALVATPSSGGCRVLVGVNAFVLAFWVRAQESYPPGAMPVQSLACRCPSSGDPREMTGKPELSLAWLAVVVRGVAVRRLCRRLRRLALSLTFQPSGCASARGPCGGRRGADVGFRGARRGVAWGGDRCYMGRRFLLDLSISG